MSRRKRLRSALSGGRWVRFRPLRPWQRIAGIAKKNGKPFLILVKIRRE